MRINTETRQVTTTGLTEENDTRAFTIKADAAMFKMLSSTLYTHKIRAVIRELTCNAWDAHQAAKRYEIPIEVHCPTHMEPYFEVKDYGKGLSHENVMKLFSTYGESTKQGSNKEIGGFGIGSKSPFCYVDSFLVESRFNGLRSSYNAFIERNGSPSITLLGQFPMADGELSGITVKMNASTKDINEFEKEGKAVLSMFAKPEVKANIEWNKIEEVYQNSFGKVIKNSGYYNEKTFPSGLSAVMGNVVYPIPSSVLESKTYKLDGKEKRLDEIFSRHNAYVFPFLIGELEIAPSREQLSLTKDTQTQILNKLNLFIAAFIEERKEKLKVHAYPWQFLEASQEMKDILTIPLLNFKGSQDYIFNDTTICEEIRRRLNALNDRYNQHNLLLEIEPTWGDGDKIMKRGYEGKGYHKGSGKLNWVWNSTNSNYIQNSNKARSKPPIILLMLGGKERVDSDSIKYKYFLKDNAFRDQIVYTIKIPYNDPQYLRVLKRRMLHLPESSYVWFKDLPMPTEEQLKARDIRTNTVVAAKELGKPREFVVYDLRERQGELFTGTHNRVTSPELLPEYTELEDKEVLYYVNFDEFKKTYVNPMDWSKEHAGKEFLFSYWYDKPNRPQIFGLCQTHIDMIKDNPKFVNAVTLFASYVPEILENCFYYPIDWQKKKASMEAYGNVRGMGFAMGQHKSKDKELTQYMQIIDRIKQNSGRYFVDNIIESIVEYGKRFGVTIPQSTLDKPKKNSQDDEKFLVDFLAKYPMFKLPAEVTDESFKLYQEYYATMKANQKKRKN